MLTGRALSQSLQRNLPAQTVYCTGLLFLMVLSEVFSSNIQSALPGFSQVCRLVLTGGGAGLLLLKCLFLTRYPNRRQWIILLAALGYAAFAAVYGGDRWFFLAVLIGVGAKDVDLHQALRVYLAAAVAGLAFVQLLHFAAPDLMPYSFYCRNWDFGYGHYNGYGARLAGVAFAWGWLRWPKLRWFDWAGLTAIDLYILLVPGSRGAGGAVTLMLALFALQRAAPQFFTGRLWRWGVPAFYPAAAALSLLSGYLFTPEKPDPVLGTLNRLLSGRLEIWHHVFWGFPLLHPAEDGVPAWYHDNLPNVFSLLGGLSSDGDQHHAIDNMYLALPMNKGILGAVIVGCVFLFLLWRLSRGGYVGETICLVALLAYLLMENKPFLISANPFILLLPCALLTERGQALPTVCPPAPPRQHAASTE